MNLHPESELERVRSNEFVCTGHLYNAGLRHPSAVVAYQAVIFAGGSAELAFEAARRHCLVQLPPLDGETLTAEQHARDEGGSQSALLQRRKTERREVIDRIRSLPNPFAQGVESQDLPLREVA